MKTQATHIRIPVAQIEEARRRGLSIPEIMRKALAKALGQAVCPTCGTPIKKEKTK